MTRKTSKFSVAALTATLTLLAQTLMAQVTFTDDFARAEIGPDWTVDQGNWWIENDRLTSGNTSTDNVISFREFNLGDTPSFTLESNLAVVRDAGWGGIAFHVQDANNYYALRIRPSTDGIQLIRNIDGAIGASFSTTVPGGLTAGETYLLGVDSPAAGEFNVYLRDGTGATLFEASRTETALSGGFAGFFSGSTGGNNVINMSADDFSLQVVPEPATAGLVAGVLAVGSALWWRRRRA